MDDQDLEAHADAATEYRPASTSTWMTWVWVSVIAIALLAGVAGGNAHPHVNAQTGHESFGLGGFVGYLLLGMLLCAPTVLVAGMVKKGIDAQADLAERIEQLAAAVPSRAEAAGGSPAERS